MPLTRSQSHHVYQAPVHYVPAAQAPNPYAFAHKPIAVPAEPSGSGLSCSSTDGSAPTEDGQTSGVPMPQHFSQYYHHHQQQQQPQSQPQQPQQPQQQQRIPFAQYPGHGHVQMQMQGSQHQGFHPHRQFHPYAQQVAPHMQQQPALPQLHVYPFQGFNPNHGHNAAHGAFRPQHHQQGNEVGAPFRPEITPQLYIPSGVAVHIQVPLQPQMGENMPPNVSTQDQMMPSQQYRGLVQNHHGVNKFVLPAPGVAVEVSYEGSHESGNSAKTTATGLDPSQAAFYPSTAAKPSLDHQARAFVTSWTDATSTLPRSNSQHPNLIRSQSDKSRRGVGREATSSHANNGTSRVATHPQESEPQDCSLGSDKRTESAPQPALPSNSGNERHKDLAKLWQSEFWRAARQNAKVAYEGGLRFLARAPSALQSRICLDLAELARRNHRIQQARILYQAAIHLNPTSAQTYIEYARMEEDAGELKRSLYALEMALQRCEPQEALLIKALKQYERVGDLAGARSVMARVADADLEKTRRFLAEGALFEARAGSEKTARQVFKYLLQNAGSYGPIYIEAAKFEENRDCLQQANSIVQAGLTACPKFGPLWITGIRLCFRLTARSLIEANQAAKLKGGKILSPEPCPYLSLYEKNTICFQLREFIDTTAQNVGAEFLWKVLLGRTQIEVGLANFKAARKYLAMALRECPAGQKWMCWTAGAQLEVTFALHQMKLIAASASHTLDKASEARERRNARRQANQDKLETVVKSGLCTTGSTAPVSRLTINVDDTFVRAGGSDLRTDVACYTPSWSHQSRSLSTQALPYCPSPSNGPQLYSHEQVLSDKLQHEEWIPNDCSLQYLSVLVLNIARALMVASDALTHARRTAPHKQIAVLLVESARIAEIAGPISESIYALVSTYPSLLQKHISLLTEELSAEMAHLEALSSHEVSGERPEQIRAEMVQEAQEHVKSIQARLTTIESELAQVTSILGSEMPPKTSHVRDLVLKFAASSSIYESQTPLLDPLSRYIQEISRLKTVTEEWMKASNKDEWASSWESDMELLRDDLDEGQDEISENANQDLNISTPEEVALYMLFPIDDRVMLPSLPCKDSRVKEEPEITPLRYASQRRARAFLALARADTGADWKTRVELLFFELRGGRRHSAVLEAESALERFPGTGRLWALLVWLRQTDGPRAQLEAFMRAVQETPKSGEVWSEGAKLCLNPTHSGFNLKMAAQLLQFALHFTPQYGDSFVELLRAQLLVEGSSDRASVERTWRVCVNTDPNYGLQWSAASRSSGPVIFNTVKETFKVAAIRVENELKTFKSLYQRAIARSLCKHKVVDEEELKTDLAACEKAQEFGTPQSACVNASFTSTEAALAGVVETSSGWIDVMGSATFDRPSRRMSSLSNLLSKTGSAGSSAKMPVYPDNVDDNHKSSGRIRSRLSLLLADEPGTANADSSRPPRSMLRMWGAESPSTVRRLGDAFTPRNVGARHSLGTLSELGSRSKPRKRLGGSSVMKVTSSLAAAAAAATAPMSSEVRRGILFDDDIDVTEVNDAEALDVCHELGTYTEDLDEASESSEDDQFDYSDQIEEDPEEAVLETLSLLEQSMRVPASGETPQHQSDCLADKGCKFFIGIDEECDEDLVSEAARDLNSPSHSKSIDQTGDVDVSSTHATSPSKSQESVSSHQHTSGTGSSITLPKVAAPLPIVVVPTAVASAGSDGASPTHSRASPSSATEGPLANTPTRWKFGGKRSADALCQVSASTERESTRSKRWQLDAEGAIIQTFRAAKEELEESLDDTIDDIGSLMRNSESAGLRHALAEAISQADASNDNNTLDDHAQSLLQDLERSFAALNVSDHSQESVAGVDSAEADHFELTNNVRLETDAFMDEVNKAADNMLQVVHSSEKVAGKPDDVSQGAESQILGISELKAKWNRWNMHSVHRYTQFASFEYLCTPADQETIPNSEDSVESVTKDFDTLSQRLSDGLERYANHLFTCDSVLW